MKDDKIEGGYYIKARCIQESEIAHAPPHVREIWDFLIKEANHRPMKIYGNTIERGQCLRSYKDMQEGLHWMIGWRKQTYSKDNCETAMKWLTKRNMITTKKTIRGLLITVCNYGFYQNPKSYENHNETDKKTTREPQTSDTINNNKKNNKKKNKPAAPPVSYEDLKKATAEKILQLTEILKSRNGSNNFIPQTFMQQCAKKQIPIQVVNYILGEMIEYAPQIHNFWAYAQKILKRENGNYHGSRSLSDHLKIKKEEAEYAAVAFEKIYQEEEVQDGRI